MIAPELLARVRAQVAVGLDAGAMLSVYSDPARRGALRERVRAAAGAGRSAADIDAICAELFGFGILQPLLDDPSVTDVLVNTPTEIFVERAGRLERVPIAFADSGAVTELAHRIASGVGRELTLEHPFVDARMRDGSRANAVVAPVGGPSLSIRKFSRATLALAGPEPSWTASGGLTAPAAALLASVVVARANVLIVGATGAGKSTLLRSMAAHIPAGERIVVIEDTNELVLPHPHVVHLECAPARDGGVAAADLVANALRMRPDRIILGEVRTPREATSLLDALTTGHEGSLTTAHAGSAAGAIDRLELLLARAGESAPQAVRSHVLRAFDLIVHVARSARGRLVGEIVALDEGALHPIYHHGADALAPLPRRLRSRL